eukprot:m.182386 g.182386  ORF g.182386 m.182386 type:complete len:328 (-) comp18062_c3_seq1:784-1767(-)
MAVRRTVMAVATAAATAVSAASGFVPALRVPKRAACDDASSPQTKASEVMDRLSAWQLGAQDRVRALASKASLSMLDVESLLTVTLGNDRTALLKRLQMMLPSQLAAMEGLIDDDDVTQPDVAPTFLVPLVYLLDEQQSLRTPHHKLAHEHKDSIILEASPQRTKLIKQLRHFLGFAAAAYHCSPDSIGQCLGSQYDDWEMHCSVTCPEFAKPAHSVLVDHKDKHVVVAIKGTSSVVDLLTDLTLEASEVHYRRCSWDIFGCSGHMHAGIHDSGTGSCLCLRCVCVRCQKLFATGENLRRCVCSCVCKIPRDRVQASTGPFAMTKPP